MHFRCLDRHSSRAAFLPATGRKRTVVVVPHASASGRSSGRGSSGRGSGTFQQGRSAPRRRLHRRDEQSDGEEYDEDELPISDSEVGRLRRLMQKQAAAGNGNWGQVLVDAEGVARLVTEDDDASNANHGPADMRGSSNSRVPEDGPSTSGRNLETSLQFEAATSSVKPAASSIPIVRPHGEDKGTFFSGKSWAQLGATAEVVAALKSLGIAKPSHIQAEAFQQLVSPRTHHVALADQAGSGKTLAYLVPLIQQLKQHEKKLGAPSTQPNSPRIIILAPTKELVEQVYRVTKALSRAGLPFRSLAMTGGTEDHDRRAKSFKTQKVALEAGVDVVICTPGRLLSHLEKGILKLDATKAIVLDEVDCLCGAEVNYTQDIKPVQDVAPPGLRFVLVSATLPQHICDQLQQLFPGLQAMFGPGLHRPAAGLTEELIDCSGGEEISLESGTARKLDALFAALRRHRSARTVVFCNKIETCRVVENSIRRSPDGAKYKVVAYHEAIRDDIRQAALAQFLAPVEANDQSTILVCTDRTSRGIDSMYCQHVVLFDFPRDPSEYVRRVGRTARGAGGRGVVSVLVIGKQVPLAQEIIARNKKGAPIHRIPEIAERYH
eukprot:jgi/Chrzof1/11827/Cz06g11130.t1